MIHGVAGVGVDVGGVAAIHGRPVSASGCRGGPGIRGGNDRGGPGGGRGDHGCHCGGDNLGGGGRGGRVAQLCHLAGDVGCHGRRWLMLAPTVHFNAVAEGESARAGHVQRQGALLHALS